MIRTATALLLSAWCAAQSPTLELRLAGSGDHPEPAAWRYVREHLLPRHPDWPVDLDASGPISLVLDERGKLQVDELPREPGGAYLDFVVSVDGSVALRGECDPSGTERWWLSADVIRRSDRLVAAFERFALDASTGTLTVDVPTLTGNIMVGAPPGDPIGELLTVGALECGSLDIVATPAQGDDTEWRVIGHGGGGLLLPALMVLVAEGQSSRAADDTADPLATSDLDRWSLLALTARGDEQYEAVRQLSRFDDPRATHVLEALLHGDEHLRAIAAQSLARSGVSDHAVESFARPARPDRTAACTTPYQLILSLATGVMLAIVTCLAARRFPAPPGEAS